MKTLYLTRHAKSSWSNPQLDDFDRPLNQRGLRSAPEMGKRLINNNWLPELIISSSAKRAINTAHIIAESIQYPPSHVVEADALFMCSNPNLLNFCQQLSDSYKQIMLVGHNPTWTYAIDLFSNSDIDNLPTCAVAKITFPVESWQHIANGKGVLVGIDKPKEPYQAENYSALSLPV